jgi:iron complex outermembrane receptor protein
MRKQILGLTLLCAGSLYAQDSLKTVQLEEVAVYSTRANSKTPTTYSTVSKAELVNRNFGQDVPILLNFTPSMVTTSDAGAGIGYTAMRIRGSDATRINVTINGIPINDSESHGLFWVNMPDVSASTNSIQIQRGVGTSTNGAGAFGASINMQTNNVSLEPFVQTDNVVGRFGTLKSNITVNSGLLNDIYNFEARVSRIVSDGYVDRSSSDLSSYYFSGGRFGEKTMIKMLVFGGREQTQQAWYGTPEALLTGTEDDLWRLVTYSGEYNTQEQIDNLFNSDRRFNYYLYDNEVDNYRQDHVQLHVGHSFSDVLTFSGALHFTKGEGYFEQFKADEELADYGLNPVTVGAETITNSDIVRRRWLDNAFGGVTYSLNYSQADWAITLGGAANTYSGDHFGEIVWAQYSGDTDIRDRYYTGAGTKDDINVFFKVNRQLTDRLNVFGDGQLRTINYSTRGTDNDLVAYDVNEQFNFFNPKVGLTYRLDGGADIYGSYAIGNREPVRSDFIDAPTDQQPVHETLRNLEIGIRKQDTKWSYQANYYLMDYVNQLVTTGQLNDVGAAVRTNVPKSYRMGVELVSAYQISDAFLWSANISFSQNKIQNFTEVVYDYGANFDEFNVVEIEHKDTDISFSPSVVAGSSLTFRPFAGVEAELLTKYVGKQYLDNTSNDDRAIDSYLTNDLRLAYSFRTNELKNVRLSLLVNNVFNIEYNANGYTWGYYYGADLYQQNNFYPQATRNFLASVSLRF